MPLPQPVVAGHDDEVREQQRESSGADQEEVHTLGQQHAEAKTGQHSTAGDEDTPVRNTGAVTHPAGGMSLLRQRAEHPAQPEDGGQHGRENCRHQHYIHDCACPAEAVTVQRRHKRADLLGDGRCRQQQEQSCHGCDIQPDQQHDCIADRLRDGDRRIACFGGGKPEYLEPGIGEHDHQHASGDPGNTAGHPALTLQYLYTDCP
ncbi:hypothetical protein D3C73_1063000 [compost metagenome]